MKNRISLGYTLVELVVAIGIIVVILSVSLAGISNIRVKSRDAKRIADIQTIQSALELHALNDPSRSYPPDPASSDVTYCTDFQTGGATYNGIYNNPCFNQYLAVTPTGPRGEFYEYHRPACIIVGGSPGTTIIQPIDKTACTNQGGVYNTSYGLHVVLESARNRDASNDSSPTDPISYDVLP